MPKDPAFLFYTADFISGVQDLTMEERGQFITLLCLQHQKGHLTEKMIKLAVGDAAADVRQKFRKDSAGLWYNERLDIEIEKRKSFSRKQSERAKTGWKHRKKKKEGDATALPRQSHYVNENVIENENENRIKNENELLENYELWTKEIIDGNDHFFQQMFMQESIPAGDHIQFLIMDHRDLLNRYPKMRPPNVHAFRKSCIKHIRENYKKQPNGTSKKREQTATTREYLKQHYGDKFGQQ